MKEALYSYTSAEKVGNNLDLISEILVHIPIKTLARFKSVSRSWRSLIDSPYFSDLHIQKSIPYCLSNLFLVRDNLFCEFINQGLNKGSQRHNLHKLRLRLSPPTLGHEVVGSCNGLLCTVYYTGIMCVTNPITATTIHLPRLEGIDFGFTCISRDTRHYLVSFGFGQDFVTKDYKVVRIDQTSSANATTAEKSEVNVLCLGTDTWKTIGVFPGFLEYSSRVHGSFANGALHWLVVQDKRIVRFDLNSEKFNFIGLPTDYSHKRRPQFYIGVLGEHLYFQVKYVARRFIQQMVVWLMDNVAVNSWFKLFEMDICSYTFPGLRPLAFAKEERKVLLVKAIKDGNFHLSTEYFWYDLRTRISKDIGRLRIAGDDTDMTQVVCFGSLVCPNRAKLCN